MSTKNVTLKEKVNGAAGNVLFPATTTPNVYDSAKSQALSQTLVNTPDYEALGFAKFSTATAYNAGDKVYKDNGLYRFIADKTAGEWDVAKVEPWSIEQEIEEVDDAIRSLIPAQASADNKLADKAYVNDKVSTDTATFRGTFNLVTDLELTTEATQGQIATALGTAISGEDKNDYAFVQIPTSDATPTEIARIDRYKYTGLQWAFEYSLNNSGFTAEQWAAINSGITSSLVAAFGAKYDKPAGGIPASDMNTSTFDNEPTAGSDNLVKSGGVAELIDTTHLKNPTEKALAKANDVIQIKTKLEGVTAEELQVNKSSLQDYIFPTEHIVKTGFYNFNGYFCTSEVNKSVKIDVSGYKSIRFLGVIRKTQPSAGQPCYCFLNANDDIIFESLVEYDIDTTLDDNTIKEYKTTIPDGAVYALLLWTAAGGLTESNFYCYLQKGESVVEVLDERTIAYETLEGNSLSNVIVNADGEVISYNTGLLIYYRVKQGKTIKINFSFSSYRNVVISIHNEKPAIGEISNILYLKRAYDDEFSYTANSDCYIAISFGARNITYNIECKQFKYFSDTVKKVDSITDEIGFSFANNEDIINYVFDLPERQSFIGNTSKKWKDYGSHVIFDATGIAQITVEPKTSFDGRIAFLKSYNNPVIGDTPDFVEGTTSVIFSQETKFIVPKDTQYIYLLASSNDGSIQERYNSIIIDGKVNIQQISDKKQPSNGILYVELDVNVNALTNGINTNEVSDSDSTTKSSFGVRFPSSYTPDGTPTRVLAMFHGYNGYVSGNAQTNVGSVLGYNNSDWINFQTTFVNAGFAVMDINGYGIYNVNNNYNHHWGCPGAVMTVKKAFEYLKANYNVCNEMLIFGFSMGGCIAWSYTMNFPEDVIAVAMHEPAVPTNNDEQDSQSVVYPTIAQAYGYNNWTDVEADDYSNFVGYSLPLSLQRYDNGVANFSGIIGFDISHELTTGIELIGSFPRPVRIWQGTKVEPGEEGEIVSVALNENIVNALRKSGCNASIRYCPNLGHSDLKTTQYVIDETLYFLNRYK